MFLNKPSPPASFTFSAMCSSLLKVCALSDNLDGSEDNEIIFIKHGPSDELLNRLQSIGEDVDLFHDITDDNVTQEDIADLQVYFDHDEDVTVDILM